MIKCIECMNSKCGGYKTDNVTEECIDFMHRPGEYKYVSEYDLRKMLPVVDVENINQCCNCYHTFVKSNRGQCPFCGSGQWVKGLTKFEDRLKQCMTCNQIFTVAVHGEICPNCGSGDWVFGLLEQNHDKYAIKQCGSCEQIFYEVDKDGGCPHCGSGNWVLGHIDEIK